MCTIEMIAGTPNNPAFPGQPVTLTTPLADLMNFGATGQLRIDGTSVPTATWSPNLIVFTVPANLADGPHHLEVQPTGLGAPLPCNASLIVQQLVDTTLYDALVEASDQVTLSVGPVDERGVSALGITGIPTRVLDVGVVRVVRVDWFVYGSDPAEGNTDPAELGRDYAYLVPPPADATHAELVPRREFRRADTGAATTTHTLFVGANVVLEAVQGALQPAIHSVPLAALALPVPDLAVPVAAALFMDADFTGDVAVILDNALPALASPVFETLAATLGTLQSAGLGDFSLLLPLLRTITAVVAQDASLTVRFAVERADANNAVERLRRVKLPPINIFGRPNANNRAQSVVVLGGPGASVQLFVKRRLLGDRGHVVLGAGTSLFAGLRSLAFTDTDGARAVLDGPDATIEVRDTPEGAPLDPVDDFDEEVSSLALVPA